jgi:hypothetical protein
MTAEQTDAPVIGDHDLEQVERANETGATPAVFVHGLWLRSSSWDRRIDVFEEAGYVGVAAMRRRPDQHDVVTDQRQRSFRYDSLEDACDAIVVDMPLGARFNVVRVRGGRFDVLVTDAIRSTTRQRS